MFCISMEPNHLDFIKNLGYIPVGLGKKSFSSEWMKDNTGKNISKKNYNREILKKKHEKTLFSVVPVVRKSIGSSYSLNTQTVDGQKSSPAHWMNFLSSVF